MRTFFETGLYVRNQAALANCLALSSVPFGDFPGHAHKITRRLVGPKAALVFVSRRNLDAA